MRATSLAKAKVRSRYVLLISLIISAVSSDETRTILGVISWKSASARSALASSSPPTICGSDRISGMALPSIVRSGQKASPNFWVERRISGSTTLRVVPMLTVLRRMMRGSGPNPGAIRWTAIRMRSRLGRWVPVSSGVPTVMMYTSWPSGGLELRVRAWCRCLARSSSRPSSRKSADPVVLTRVTKSSLVS